MLKSMGEKPTTIDFIWIWQLWRRNQRHPANIQCIQKSVFKVAS